MRLTGLRGALLAGCLLVLAGWLLSGTAAAAPSGRSSTATEVASKRPGAPLARR